VRIIPRLFHVVLLCCLSVGSAAAQPRTIRGAVFADTNGNGRRDSGESGIPGIVVSNQSDVVTTAADGQFEVPAGPTGIVFVSVPDGYGATSSFWRSTAGTDTMSFSLATRPRITTLKFIHASDTHLDTAAAKVARFRRFLALVDSVKPQLVLFGGDLIWDSMSQTEARSAMQFELFRSELAPISAIARMVPGNHDHYGIIRSRARGGMRADSTSPLYDRGMYRKYFGPDYYSFTMGGVHFVGMNSVQADDSAYYGFIDSVQLNWLKRDLEKIPATMPVVTFMHIPMATAWNEFGGYIDQPPVSSVMILDGKKQFRHSVVNRFAVLDVFKDRQYALSLNSHTHIGEKLIFELGGMKVRFETSPAIVDPGPPDGAIWVRSGFTVYTVMNGRIDAGTFVPMDRP
jgi:hypothetical protein